MGFKKDITNFEKWKEDLTIDNVYEIIEDSCTCWFCPVLCTDVCDDIIDKKVFCKTNFMKWANSEYTD